MGSYKFIAATAVLAVGIIQSGAAGAQQNNVQIVRGGQPASIIETQEAGVRVYRGSATAKPAVVADKAVDAIAQVVSAGSRVWIVDRAASRVSVCRLVSTTQVGERRIDCHTRPL